MLEDVIVKDMQGLIVIFDFLVFLGDVSIGQVYFFGVLLSELDVLCHVFILQQLLTFTEVIRPSGHKRSKFAPQLFELKVSLVVLLRECVAFPRLLVELFPAVQKLIFGLFESVEEGLLVLVPTFDVLVRRDVFLKFSCYFVAPSRHKDGLLDARLEIVEFAVGGLVELVAEGGEVGRDFVGVGEGAVDIVATYMVDLAAWL